MTTNKQEELARALIESQVYDKKLFNLIVTPQDHMSINSKGDGVVGHMTKEDPFGKLTISFHDAITTILLHHRYATTLVPEVDANDLLYDLSIAKIRLARLKQRTYDFSLAEPKLPLSPTLLKTIASLTTYIEDLTHLERLTNGS
jgi:hypothetical protein